MSFPIFRHEMPWESSRDVRARSADWDLDDGGADRTSFWKRDRSLRRRTSRADEQAVHVDAATSGWDEPEDEPEVEASSERTSIWKREISFGRRKGDDDGSDDSGSEDGGSAWWPTSTTDEPAEVDDVDAVEDVDSLDDLPQEAVAEQTSFWKRERSFGRRRDRGDDDAGTTSEAEESVDLDVSVPSMTSYAFEEAEPVAEELTEPEPVAPIETLSTGSVWTSDHLVDVQPAEDRASFDVAAGFDEAPAFDPPVFEPEPESVYEAPSPWSETSFDTASEDASAAHPDSEPAPVREESPWQSAWTVEPTAGFEVEDAVAEQPESASPALSFAAPDDPDTDPEVEEAPVVDAPIAPPVSTNAESEPDEEHSEQPSFWKRERSFGRRKARDEQAQVEEPSAEHAAAAAAVPLVVAAVGAEKKTPIWKRDLSFRRKGRDWEYGHGDAAESVEPAPAALAEPTAEAFEYVPEPEHEQTIDVEADNAADTAAEGAEKKRFKRTPRTGGKRTRTPKGSKGAKKLVGLRVGASQIAAAYVQSNGSYEVLKMARTPLERGVVVSGELRDPDALVVALKEFFNENKLPKRNIRLGIASNRVGVRVLDVDGVEDPALLGNAVRFRAQEVLPIPLSEAVLDYRVLRERTDDEGNVTREVLVAFAYRELVDRYASVCRSAGLRLVGIDLDGFALLRALVDPRDEDGRLGGAAVVTVALGHDRSIMSVSDGTVCEFTRVIDWGGSALDTAVARILALTPSQAEPLKRELTLDRLRPAPENLSEEQAGRARSAMVQEVHAFAREFVSSLQFYQAQPRSLDIGEIVITGGMAHMPGLAQQLQELIGVTVRVGDPLARVKLGKHVETEESIGSFALAIGLGIED